MTNYEASKASDKVVVARHVDGGYIVFYATADGRCLGQPYKGATRREALRALENSADEYADEQPWRAQAAYNPEFRGAARPRAGEDY